MSWYRTYRPQRFADLHITPVREAFVRILESGEFSHAYLFTGPKGTGKTSAARILAKVLNCEGNRQHKPKTPLLEPCGICSSCRAIDAGASLCVSEMDAASNRGIDDIRLLRDRIGLSPSDGIISVFIIDEVHMLTAEAFNALLKVLEEPPAHVVFILATTDAIKVPSTVVSRCTRIVYRKASDAEIVQRLTQIAQMEEIEVESALLSRIAVGADGSFRDGVKLFEQIASGKKKIVHTDLDAVFGTDTSRLAADLLTALLAKKTDTILSLFEKIHTLGIDGVAFQKEVVGILHSKLFTFAQTRDARLSRIVELLSVACAPIEPLAPIPWLPFEIAVLQYVVDRKTDIQARLPTRQAHRETDLPADEAGPSADEAGIQSAYSQEELAKQWAVILTTMHAKNIPVEGLLRSVKPLTLQDGTLHLSASYAFHKEQLLLDRNLRLIEDVCAQIFGGKVRLSIQLDAKGAPLTVAGGESLLTAANEAFL